MTEEQREIYERLRIAARSLNDVAVLAYSVDEFVLSGELFAAAAVVELALRRVAPEVGRQPDLAE